MGRRLVGLILMLFYSTMATTSALREILPTEESNYHQKTQTENYGKDGVSNYQLIGTRYSASASTVSHGIGLGRAGGGENGGGGGGGGSRPRTGGGGAVIPIYAAGSAQAHHRQGRPHNAGNRYVNNMGLLVAVLLAAIAQLLLDV